MTTGTTPIGSDELDDEAHGFDIPLCRPFTNARERDLVDEVLRSGSLHDGPMLRRFEARVEHLTGAAHAIGVSSPVTAIRLVAATAGWGDGDDLVVSPFTSVGTDVLTRLFGVTTTMVDLDPTTLGVAAGPVLEAVGERTRGVLLGDAFGWPTPLEAITDGIGADAVVVGDLGGDLAAVRGGGVRLYALDGASELSLGSGAVLCTDDAATAAAWRELAARRAIDCVLPDIVAALGLAQLERLPRTVAMYELVADDYRRMFAGVSGVDVPVGHVGDVVRSWRRFWVRFGTGEVRDHVRRTLARDGIETVAAPVAGSLPPVAADVAARSLAVPCHPQLSPQEQERVVAAVAAALDDA